MAPAASIVIPTFNRSALVCRAIDSCLAQSRQDIEILVVDDGSTDDTPARVAAYGDRITYLRQDHRRQAAARNLGIDHAAAPWVLFLDSDDRFLPGKVASDLATAKRCPEAALIYGGMRDVSSSGGHVREYCAPFSGDVLERLMLGNFIVGASVAVKREVLKELGGFRTEPKLAEDWELWLRIAARYPVCSTGLVEFERTLDTSSMMSDADWMAEAMQAAVGLAFEDAAVGERVTHLRRHAEANVANLSAAGYATAGRRRETLRYLVRAIMLRPVVMLTPLFLYNLGRTLTGIRRLPRRPKPPPGT